MRPFDRSPIIPHCTSIEKLCSKFVFAVPCGLSRDNRCEFHILLIPLWLKVASSVDSINWSNWQLVCNQWQNSRCMVLFPGCWFCTCCGRYEYKPSSCSVRHTRVRETDTCTESLHASSRASLYHFKNAFPFLHMLTCLFGWNMSAGKRTTFMQCIEHWENIYNLEFCA
jgi:hypothetical protein